MGNPVQLSMTPPVPKAPIYSGKYFRRNPIRVPPPPDLMGLQNGKPFWIPIFDTATLPGLAGGVLAPGASAENNYQLTADFAWLANMLSYQATSVNYPFSLQLSATTQDAQGDPTTTLFQKTPIICNLFGGGTNQGGAAQPLSPLYLRKPVLFKAGTELLVRVQSNLFTPAGVLAIQFCLFGYIEG